MGKTAKNSEAMCLAYGVRMKKLTVGTKTGRPK